jgi:hypothetical protein
VPPVPVQLNSRRVYKVVRDGSSGPVRDPAHRVGDVTIEAGEEPEPVFAGQVLSAVLARPWHRKAPGLTSGNGKKLVDLDVEIALDQLVRRTEARDAAAEDDDLWIHGSVSRILPRSNGSSSSLYMVHPSAVSAIVVASTAAS